MMKEEARCRIFASEYANLEEYVHKPSIYELTREGFCLVSSMKERVRWRGKRKKRDGRRAGLVPRILALVGG